MPVGLPDSLRYYDFASRMIRDVLKLQKDFSDSLWPLSSVFSARRSQFRHNGRRELPVGFHFVYRRSIGSIAASYWRCPMPD